jgi:hypothetical protein
MSIKVFVTTEVVLAKQVAIVKGLNRKLCNQLALNCWTTSCSHLAAIAKELYLKCRLGDLNSRDVVAMPELAMCVSIWALMRSSRIYRMFVTNGYDVASGRRAKSGRSSGAWWKTPPS